MAVEPQIDFPVVFEDFDGTPGSGTPFNAANLNPNFVEAANKFNAHTHDLADLADAPAGVLADGQTWVRQAGVWVYADVETPAGAQTKADAAQAAAELASDPAGSAAAAQAAAEAASDPVGSAASAQAAAEAASIPLAQKGVPNGVATLDASGLVPAASLGGSVTYVHAPTGTVSVDKTVLSDAIADTAEGGVVMLANGGDTPYATDETWTIDKQLTITGQGVVPVGMEGTSMTPTVAPFLTGSVILQTAAGTDGVLVDVNAKAPSLKRFGVRFDAPGTVAFVDTGHGIVARTSAVFGAGTGISIISSVWEDLWVWGHDGDHYGRLIVNPANGCTFLNMRSYGGGVVRYLVDSAVLVCGNLVDIHPVGDTFVAGTAHAYAFAPFAARGAQGGLDLITVIRPQVLMDDYSAFSALGNPAKSLSSQYMWQAKDGDFEAVNVSVIDPDLESPTGSNPVNFGSATSGNVVQMGGAVLTGGSVVNLNRVITGVEGASDNAAYGVGNQAVSGNTSGQRNTGVGRKALAANATGDDSTAVGNQALAAATTGPNTAVGSASLKANTTGIKNTALGGNALAVNTTGSENVAVGNHALGVAVTASSNVAVGSGALFALTGGTGHNVAVGRQALVAQTTGNDNTVVGYNSGAQTTTGSFQTVVGSGAGLSSSTQRNDIVAVGYQALCNGASAIALGSGVQALAAGAVAIGKDSGGTSTTTSVADQIALGTASHHVLFKKAAAPADASLAASQFTFWLTDTPSGAKLNVKAKDSAGTVVTGTVTLA